MPSRISARARHHADQEPIHVGEQTMDAAMTHEKIEYLNSNRTAGWLRRIWIILVLLPGLWAARVQAQPSSASSRASSAVAYKTVKIDGLDIFYREAGPANAPTLLLLHGFPASSHMFRNLIPLLAARYHVVAPDYPGFGQSSAPSPAQFTYTFERLAQVMERFTQVLGLRTYSLYMMDYGAPVGFRLAVRHPERVKALIVQNGNAYEEGLREFWDVFRTYWRDPSAANAEPLHGLLTLGVTRFQYVDGTRDESRISPDTWTLDQSRLDRPGNQEIQLALFYDYRTNVEQYPAWHTYLRTHQPPTLIVWGKNDIIFPAQGALAFRRDLRAPELHLLDTGHFALEEDLDVIAPLIRDFLRRRL
jgi:pimeloyl-ACP methyl ester carboxylesterase